MLLAILAASCVRPYSYLPPSPPLAFVRADEALRRGDYRAAEKAFADFLLTGTDRDYRPRAYYELAQAEYALGDYDAALDSLAELRREFPANDWPQVSVLRGDTAYALGNRVDAVLYWDSAWHQLPASERDLLLPRLEKAIGEATEEERRSLGALIIEPQVRSMLPEADRAGLPAASAPTGGAGAAPTAASRPAREDEVFKGDEQYAAGNRVDALLYWEAAWSESDQAERDLLAPRMERAIREASGGELDLLAQLLTDPTVLAMLPARALPPVRAAAPLAEKEDVQAEPLPASARVAALLPLTGADQLAGRGALRGLRLAFADAPAALVVRDTGSEPEMAVNLVESLAADTEVIAAIGALDQAAAAASAPAAERGRLPLVLLSRHPAIGGRFILQTGIGTEQRLRTTIAYARQQGARRFAMLYPDDARGRSFRDPFRQEVLALGGVVVGTSPYPPTGVQSLRLVPGAQGWLRAGAVDAIFIPDSPQNAAAIAREVRTTVPAAVFLGTDLWNDPAALAATGSALDGAVFADSFYAGGLLPSTRRFVGEFRSVNGRLPTALEAEAYDTAMLVRRAMSEGASDRQAMVDTLRVTRGFEGGGRLRAGAGGPERDLFLLRVRQGQIEEVTAAP